MELRQARQTKEDFKAFDELCNRTDYSIHVNQRSLELDLKKREIDWAIDYKEYCNMLKHVKERQFLMLEDNTGQVIGYAELSEEKDQAEIVDFVVKRAFQGYGKGREFYNLIEKKLQKFHVKQIILDCYFEGSMQFWLKMGFRNSEACCFIKKL